MRPPPCRHGVQWSFPCSDCDEGERAEELQAEIAELKAALAKVTASGVEAVEMLQAEIGRSCHEIGTLRKDLAKVTAERDAALWEGRLNGLSAAKEMAIIRAQGSKRAGWLALSALVIDLCAVIDSVERDK